jgi:hypothetical protein
MIGVNVFKRNLMYPLILVIITMLMVMIIIAMEVMVMIMKMMLLIRDIGRESLKDIKKETNLILRRKIKRFQS